MSAEHLPLLDPKKIYYNTLEANGKPVGLWFRERADARSGHLGFLKKRAELVRSLGTLPLELELP